MNFEGEWVMVNDRKPYYPPGSCPYIQTQATNCYSNGRSDVEYIKWQWQWQSHPANAGCRKSIPSFLNTTDFLERLRGKKLVFAWDSGTQVYGFPPGLQLYHSICVDCISGTPSGGIYTRKGDPKIGLDLRTHDGINFLSRRRAKALTTWSNWIDKNIDSNKTQAVFRGFSLTHFAGEKWNTGGGCNLETEPIPSNETYVKSSPIQTKILEDTLGKMKTDVHLNVSKLTFYRADAHPSVYGKNHTAQERIEAPQDCSHWCLPGVPDTWNELLYATLLKDGKGSFGN